MVCVWGGGEGVREMADQWMGGWMVWQRGIVIIITITIIIRP